MATPCFQFLRRMLLLATTIVLLGQAALAQNVKELPEIKQLFRHTSAVANHICLLHDNWQIALLSHNKAKVGAVFLTEAKKDSPHEFSLNATAARIAELVGLGSPVIQEMEDSDRKSAIMIDTDVVESLADDAEHVFWGSPLEGMAFLLQDGYFYIHKIMPNGFLHWKTVKKSGVELLMPMAPAKLTAVEVTGRQQMNEYAAEVLARKLGLGSNTSNPTIREAVRQQISASELVYMNTKSNIIGARANNRFVIGKRTSAAHMLSNRYGGTLLYPAQSSVWPGEKDPEQKEEKKEEKPLTPREAREAYIEYLRSLAK